VIDKDHPLAGKKQYELADFVNEVILIPDRLESPTYMDRLSERFCEAGLDVPEFQQVQDVGTMALWLEAGYGISLLNERHILYNNKSLLFIKVPKIRDLPEVVVWKKGTMNSNVSIFLHELKEWFGINE
jgi:DNA-binding transcriptional LysR family regulator